MTLGLAVKTRLLAIGPLDALVAGRVFEIILPQNERRAAVRVYAVGQARPTHIRGPINHFDQRVQVDAYVPLGTVTATDPDPLDSVRAVGAAVLGDGLGAGLAGWSGVVGGSPDESIQILDVHVENDGDLTYEDDEQRRVRLRQEYRVFWRGVTTE